MSQANFQINRKFEKAVAKWRHMLPTLCLGTAGRHTQAVICESIHPTCTTSRPLLCFTFLLSDCLTVFHHGFLIQVHGNGRVRDGSSGTPGNTHNGEPATSTILKLRSSPCVLTSQVVVCFMQYIFLGVKGVLDAVRTGLRKQPELGGKDWTFFGSVFVISLQIHG